MTVIYHVKCTACVRWKHTTFMISSWMKPWIIGKVTGNMFDKMTLPLKFQFLLLRCTSFGFSVYFYFPQKRWKSVCWHIIPLHRDREREKKKIVSLNTCCVLKSICHLITNSKVQSFPSNSIGAWHILMENVKQKYHHSNEYGKRFNNALNSITTKMES